MINVQQEKFTGPLGLLLELIEREELDITEISLAKIADQYIDYIKNYGRSHPGEMADFLVVAAKLLLIKSRALLPYLCPEEEKEIEELEMQLKMYKEFLEAAKKISKILGRKKFMFAREFNRQAILSGANLFYPPQKLKAGDLAAVFSDLLVRIRPVRELEEETLEHKITIEEKIMAIQNMLLNRIKMSFSNVMAEAKSKTEIIVSFLAMLELIKQREVMVSQESLFDEILISRMA
jgi:segregation and condensation protein A